MSNSTNRLYFMDSMRSILMMLGVVIHSAGVFSTKHTWVIYSDKTDIFSDHIVEFIHLFRMPAFFVISGFFCIFTILKYNPIKFLKIRISRIVIPLIITAVTLNTIQALFLNYIDFQNCNLRNYIIYGGWVSHLWFLNNLIIYFIMAGVAVILFKNPLKRIGEIIYRIFLYMPPIVVLLIMPSVSIGLIGMYRLGSPWFSYLWFIPTSNVMHYLPFFVFGCILGSKQELLYKFTQINLFLYAALTVCVAYVLNTLCFQHDTLFQQALNIYLETLNTWLLIAICFYVFHHFFNKPSKTWLFLSDASYTVYLFHHVIAIVLGYCLIKIGVSPIIGIVIMIPTTLLITLSIHKYYILKHPHARYLFNGKSLKNNA